LQIREINSVSFEKRPSLGMDKDAERLNPSRLPIVKCCPVILSCREREREHESFEVTSSPSTSRVDFIHRVKATLV
jgi:hypothetical protein